MKKLLLLFAAIMMASTGLWAETQNVSYLYPVYNTDGVPTSGIKEWKTGSVEATVVTDASEQVTWNAGWYVVTGTDVTLPKGSICNGDVHLILADGAMLTVGGGQYVTNAGIQVSGDGNSLTIYGQTAQTGKLEATTFGYAAGIGGKSGEDGHDITINGGKIDAEGYASGIGGGNEAKGYNITINGGEVMALSRSNGAGIGGGSNGVEHEVFVGAHCDGHDITINGGIVTADGGIYASGIGGGSMGYGTDITINGGRVIATVNIYGDGGGAGIGGGYKGVGRNITFTNGFVTAIGGVGASGIGNGADAVGSQEIFAVKRCYVRAGDSINPTDEIAHEYDTDLANQLNGNQYVTVIYDLIDAYNNGYAAGNEDGLQKGKADALGTMGTEQTGNAVEVIKGRKKVILYNPDKVNFIKVETEE